MNADTFDIDSQYKQPNETGFLWFMKFNFFKKRTKKIFSLIYL